MLFRSCKRQKKCPYASSQSFGFDTQTAPCLDTMSDVQKHVYFFSHADYSLSPESIVEGHRIQSISKGVDIKQRAIMNIMSDAKVAPTTQNISDFVNPAASGLWGRDGNFDEKQYEKLCQSSISDGGKRIITKQIFVNFMNHLHGNKDLGTATTVFYIIPVPWKKVTEGSIDELFLYYNDHWYLNLDTMEYESAFTLDHLKRFYKDSYNIMQMRKDSLLPVPKPIK